jgi:large subunit ribosomal protein L3
MVHGLWGKKIGMTQVFSGESKVVPVTVIDISDWYVTQVKTVATDGYTAVQLGRVKKKFAADAFSNEWLKKPSKYFSAFKEITCAPEDLQADQEEARIKVGQPGDAIVGFAQGDFVDVFGITKGHGFQGGVKRHQFNGGPGSHGSNFHKRPGSLSFMRSLGRVIKGKKLPGHMGVDRVAMKNLEVVNVEPDARVVLVKGSIPGKSGSLVFVRKCR